LSRPSSARMSGPRESVSSSGPPSFLIFDRAGSVTKSETAAAMITLDAPARDSSTALRILLAGAYPHDRDAVGRRQVHGR